MVNWELIILESVMFFGIYLFLAVMYYIHVLISGWFNLASVYKPDKMQDTIHFRMKRIVIGKSNFPFGLDIKFSASGLYLLVPWLFRFGLPEIYIPWEELKPTSRYRLASKRIEFIAFSVSFPNETQIMIPVETLFKAKSYLPKDFTEKFNGLDRV